MSSEEKKRVMNDMFACFEGDEVWAIGTCLHLWWSWVAKAKVCPAQCPF